MRDDDVGVDESGIAVGGSQQATIVTTTSTGSRKKKRKRRKSKNKPPPIQQLRLQEERGQSAATHVVVNFPTSCDELEPAAECSKSRDSTSSLGGPSTARHSTLRESLLTVLGKLVVWKGTRYRATPTSSSSAPPNSPPATECIGRSTVFFSSGEFSSLLNFFFY